MLTIEAPLGIKTVPLRVQVDRPQSAHRPALPDNLDPMSSRCISAKLAGDAALDDDVVIQLIGGLWAMVSSKIIMA